MQRQERLAGSRLAIEHRHAGGAEQVLDQVAVAQPRPHIVEADELKRRLDVWRARRRRGLDEPFELVARAAGVEPVGNVALRAAGPAAQAAQPASHTAGYWRSPGRRAGGRHRHCRAARRHRGRGSIGRSPPSTCRRPRYCRSRAGQSLRSRSTSFSPSTMQKTSPIGRRQQFGQPVEQPLRALEVPYPAGAAVVGPPLAEVLRVEPDGLVTQRAELVPVIVGRDDAPLLAVPPPISNT